MPQLRAYGFLRLAGFIGLRWLKGFIGYYWVLGAQALGSRLTVCAVQRSSLNHQTEADRRAGIGLFHLEAIRYP